MMFGCFNDFNMLHSLRNLSNPLKRTNPPAMLYSQYFSFLSFDMLQTFNASKSNLSSSESFRWPLCTVPKLPVMNLVQGMTRYKPTSVR